MKQHIHRELGVLTTKIARLGGMVEASIGKALSSILDADEVLARKVREEDDAIDSLEVEIEERCLSILALYQPVARDLRYIVTILKVNNELEHMGDLAENIARQTRQINRSSVDKTRIDLVKMAEETQKMVSLSLDALVRGDVILAEEVIRMDDRIDRFHRDHHLAVADNINDDDKSFSVAELALLNVSRSLERIADMATSIAEDVIYFVDAKIVRHRSW